jgi:hypothetical protein
MRPRANRSTVTVVTASVRSPSTPAAVVSTGTPAATASSTLILGPDVSGQGNANTAARDNTSVELATDPRSVTPARLPTRASPRPASSNRAAGIASWTAVQAPRSAASARRLGSQVQSASRTATGWSISGRGLAGMARATGSSVAWDQAATRAE